MRLRIFFIFFGVLFFVSCSVTKHLQEKQRVHVDTEIVLLNPESISTKKKVIADLTLIGQPKPATGIKKFQTNIYNKSLKSKRQKGFKKWMANKFGQPPILFDPPKVERSRLVMEKYMKDNGYFGATVKLDTIGKGKKVFVHYKVFSEGQYRIRNIDYPKESSGVARLVAGNIKESLLQPQEPYLQLNLATERIRLAELANNSGYLNVSQEDFYFFADTTIGNKQVDIFLKIKQPKDSTTFQRYFLDNDVVYGNYSLTSNTTQNDTTLLDNFIIIQKNDIVRPKVLAYIIGGDRQETFSKKKQEDVLTRLLDLGIYKFVNVKFDTYDKDSIFYFNRNFYLTPTLMQDVSTEFQVNTRSGNYLGIGSSVTYTHKNLFRGAERLDISLSGGLETQLGNSFNFINTIDIGLQSDLSIPDFILPFKVQKGGGAYVPRTKLGIGDNFQRRAGFYSSNNFNFKFGYEWNELPDRRHMVYPFNINQIQVFGQTEDFINRLLENPRLSKSFEDVFILGLEYNFIYNTIRTNLANPYSYLKVGFETSGNIPSLLAKLSKSNVAKPYHFGNVPFAQFVKIDLDYRRNIPFNQNLLASRFFIGVGVPYNNSNVLPFVKQFYAGGSGSVRAFRLRELGPGSYESLETTVNNSFTDQTGDIKLELNLEYRFPVFSYLKGAVFLDAGNIWLIKDVENNRPEGLFQFNRFYKEIAVGTGLGFRLDFGFVVVRLDGSFALRKSFVTNEKYWTFSELNFSQKTWRKDNLIWHIAIGYPF